MDTDSFTWYITEQLAPTLRPGQVVVVDNLSAHKADRIRQAIEARGCQLLFLPPLYGKVSLSLPGREEWEVDEQRGAGERLCRPCGATASE